MISFKYFNRFLVASLLLAGQMSNVKAGFKQQQINAEVARINNSVNSEETLHLNNKGITDKDQVKLIGILQGIPSEKREKIKIIELFSNKMGRLPYQVLALFPNAESIDFNGNQLNLSKDFLPKTPFNKIKSVCIAYNELKKIDEEFFNLFPSLLELNIHGNHALEISLEALKRLSKCKKVKLWRTPLAIEIKELVTNSLQPKNPRDQIILDCLENFEDNCFRDNSIAFSKDVHIAIDTYTLITKFHMPQQAEIATLKEEINLQLAVIAQKNDTIKGLCAALGNPEDEALQ